jgi:outer membrane protein OmpA-like peptidoglycan-associated protein
MSAALYEQWLQGEHPASFSSEGESQAFSEEWSQNWSESWAEGEGSIGESSQWQSPFAPVSLSESEVAVGTKLSLPGTDTDVTFQGKAWPFTPKAGSGGKRSTVVQLQRATVFEVRVSDFDIDGYKLKEPHKAAIRELVEKISAQIKQQMIQPPIVVYAYGEASSTASVQHNITLSEHRAFNVLNRIKHEFAKAAISGDRIGYAMYGTGEEHADIAIGNPREAGDYRGVVVRVVGLIPECAKCDPPSPRDPDRPRDPEKPRDPVYPPTGSSLCISVPRIHPRRTTGLAPDVIPLGSVIPGLRLPVAIVRQGRADILVEDRRQHMAHRYSFSGWGLEVALPSNGRVGIDLRAELRATIEVIATFSARLAGSLQLGAIGLALRIDASVFAKLVAQLTAHLRLHLDIGLGLPKRPELQACSVIAAPKFDPAMLAGTGFLVVPGRGYGAATLTFAGGRVPFAKRSVAVPSDKSTIKTLLIMGGELRPTGSSRPGRSGRESEFETEFESLGEGLWRSSPFGESPLTESLFNEGPYGEGPYGEGPYGEGPNREGPYGEGPYGEGPYGEGPYGEGTFGEQLAAFA